MNSAILPGPGHWSAGTKMNRAYLPGGQSVESCSAVIHLSLCKPEFFGEKITDPRFKGCFRLKFIMCIDTLRIHNGR